MSMLTSHKSKERHAAPACWLLQRGGIINTTRLFASDGVKLISPNIRTAVKESVSAEIPDWSREKPRKFWDPGRKLLLAIRRYQYWEEKNGRGPQRLICKWLAFRHRFWTVMSGADVPLNCNIGGGLLIPHPNGIVIHPRARIGVNCLILQQVTLGTTDGPGVPVIEGHVDIGAGAKILGAVHIGPHARIGANAVVLSDVPARAVAVGVPAKIIGSDLAG